MIHRDSAWGIEDALLLVKGERLFLHQYCHFVSNRSSKLKEAVLTHEEIDYAGFCGGIIPDVGNADRGAQVGEDQASSQSPTVPIGNRLGVPSRQEHRHRVQPLLADDTLPLFSEDAHHTSCQTNSAREQFSLTILFDSQCSQLVSCLRGGLCETRCPILEYPLTLLSAN
jgi:hypothetical protein